MEVRFLKWFQSWTFSYLYLWPTMWFHAEKLLKTLKLWKSLILLCNLGFRPSKSLFSRLTESRFTQFFQWVWHILGGTMWKSTSRAFRICMAKGGRESARPSYGRPKLTLISREKNHLLRCFAKPFGHNFQISGLPLNQRYLLYIKIPLIQWLGSILKIVAERFCETPF